MRAIFKKFGVSLACPDTGVKLLEPRFLRDDLHLSASRGFQTQTVGALRSPSALKGFAGQGLDLKPNLLRSFSTKVSTNQNTEQILPYFITGFVDAL